MVADKLVPDLAEAQVPPNTRFPIRVPLLVHQNLADHNHAMERFVQTRDGTLMFKMKITRRIPNPHETNHPEEYISFKLPEDDTKELVLCAFGRPQGKLECHIYQKGKDPWGIIKEDGDAGPGSGQYTIYLRNSLPALTAYTTAYNSKDRRVRIHRQGDKDQPEGVDIALATASGDEWYEVECYPNCDIILAIVMLTGVDRMANLNAKK